MRDFTFSTYRKLIKSIRDAGYEFQTLEEFLLNPAHKVVILRHDCDIWPANDLKMATIENELQIKASYYFRMPYTFNKQIITKIKALGHEIGYHYENLAEEKGDYEKAIITFQKNLETLRELYPVRTIAMHGRPLSAWDSRNLWNRFHLEDFGILGEPYLSIDYDKVFYLTDTGSRWNGRNVSIRDNVPSNYTLNIRTTFQLINHFQMNQMPHQILLNSHAARWNDNLLIWIYRYLLQKAKNQAKFILKLFRSY